MVSKRDQDPSPEGVAIVGVGLRLPGGICGLDGLWSALIEKTDAVGEIPPQRFDAGSIFDPRGRQGKSCSRSGGFLSSIDEFDAGYFDISPREASRLDPQQRLLLECTVEALDDAGISPATLAGSDTGVVVGVSFQDYSALQSRRPGEANAYSMVGTATNNTANRISYHLDTHGPSFAVDTACSSSLTALHEAAQLVRTGRSEVALAGAANILLDPFKFVGFSSASMLSPTGRCHPFSSRADGYVRAEGVGILVLKRLSDAVAAGDRIHAVIVATDVNSDGRTVGLSLPSLPAQVELLQRVYAGAGADPEDLVYVEAHGTGTPAGDPVECAALSEVLGRRRGTPLPIGSVKSNLGHAESAAGLAGVFKAIVVLRERCLPVSLHALPLNENIDFQGLNLEPVCAARQITKTGRILVGVNSFGFGGANAHALLAAPPPAEEKAATPRSAIAGMLPIIVSARDTAALAETAQRWSGFLDRLDPDGFYDVCHTACRRRGHHRERFALIASGPAEAAAKLRALARGEQVPGAAQASSVHSGRIGFVFNGNGSQWPGMGAALLATDAAFRHEVEAWDAVLSPMLGWSVARSLSTADERHVSATEFAQPLLFVWQNAVAASLTARGVRAVAVAGHSVGEVAAAYHCGALDRHQASMVIVARSKAQGRTAGRGRMAAVRVPEEDARALLRRWGYAGRLVVAAVNGPGDVTIAGDAIALREFGAKLDAEGIGSRELDLNYAFHSPAMDVLRGQILDDLSPVAPSQSRLAFVSTVSGTVVPGTALDAGYWWRNLRQPVRFWPAMTTLTQAEGCDVLVEVGPHPVLNRYLLHCTADSQTPVAVIPTVSRSAPAAAALDTAVAQVLAAGGDVDWPTLLPVRGNVVNVPAYPWQRERHWTGGPHWWDGDNDADSQNTATHPLLGHRAASPVATWTSTLGPARQPWLSDHRIGESVILPGAAYLQLALCAGQELFRGPAEVVRLAIGRPMAVPFGERETEVRLATTVAHDGSVHIASLPVGQPQEWDEHVSGRVRRLVDDPPEDLVLQRELAECRETVEPDVHYADCAAMGLSYGPRFRSLTEIRSGMNKAVARYAVTDDATGPVSAIDGAMQLALAAAGPLHGQVFLPTRFEKARRWRDAPAEGWLVVRQVRRTPAELVVDAVITDTAGAVCLQLEGCHLRRMPTGAQRQLAQVSEVLRVATSTATSRISSHRVALPAPQDSFTAIADQVAALRTQVLDTRHFEMVEDVQELAAHFTVAAIDKILPGRKLFQLDDLVTAGVPAKFRPLLRLLLRLAARHRLVLAESTDWRLIAQARPEHVFEALAAKHPAHGVSLHLAAVAGRNLHGVLVGGLDPVDLMLGGPDSPVSQYYDHEKLMRFHNGVCCELVAYMARRLPAGQPLRILEVGAGTGATTAALLPALAPHQVHYTYTDISSGHFRAARRRFGDFDFVRFRTLDIDQEPAGQGFPHGSYDLVIAANVLHATSDLRGALRNIAQLLADGGQLLAIEVHDQFYTGPVFGLLDSYWRASDTALRPDGPLLGRSAWKALLTESGFGEPQLTHDFDGRTESISTILAARTMRAATSPPPQPIPLPGSTYLATLDEESEALAEALSAQTQHPVRVTQPTRSQAWQRAFGHPQQCRIVLMLAEPTYADPQAETQAAVRAMAVLRAIAAAAPADQTAAVPRIWIACVTSAQVGPYPVALPTAAAAICGNARALIAEDPRFDIRRITLSDWHGRPADAAAGLLNEMRSPDDEDEVTLTAAGRYVTRVRPAPALTVSSGDVPSYALVADNRGVRYGLRWRPSTIPRPAPDAIVVRVEAAALNYRDVLTVLDMLPPAPGRAGRAEGAVLGLECAGVVVAVGDEATGFRVDDRVAGMTAGAFARHVTIRSSLAFKMPEGMTFAEAATIPVAFTTVEESLSRRVRLRAGETVLVHGGAGGVGLAVWQYCRRVGAKVIATAGTQVKRDLLHALGVTDVLDSRSLRFATEVLALTGGEGVDVVVNSLSGEGLRRSLEILKPHGRFVELGKRDFLADTSLPSAPLIGNITFASVDVMDRIDGDVGAVASDYRPLPHRTYPAARIGEAFELMRHSRHVGKIVVTFAEPVEVSVPQRAPGVDPDATYLITGGLSGFGAATARHLARLGATHLCLLSRGGAGAADRTELCESLHRAGVQTAVYPVDVADSEAMRQVFTDVTRSGRRIGGVIHAALHLDDARITELDDARCAAALRAKIQGCRNLDLLTRGLSLDFFIAYSSVLTLIGNQRQSAYLAANFAVEAMMRARRAHGLAGLAIQWGAIKDVGVAHRLNLLGQLESAGLSPVESAVALTQLDAVLNGGAPPVITVADIDWRAAHLMSGTLSRPRLSAMLPTTNSTDTTAGSATPGTPKGPLTKESIVTALCELVAKVILSDPERVDRERPLAHLGIDSLMGAELSVLIHQRFKCVLPVVELLAMHNLGAVAETVLTRTAEPDSADPSARQDKVGASAVRT